MVDVSSDEVNHGLHRVIVGLEVEVKGAADKVLRAVGEDFPEELRSLAGSLKTELGRAFDLAALAAAMIEALDELYAALLTGDTAPYLAAYRQHCLTLRRDVLLVQNGASTPAHALDVDEALGLRVRYPDGREALVRSGEASVRGLTGYADREQCPGVLSASAPGHAV